MKLSEHVHEFRLVYSGPVMFHCNHEECTFILPYGEAMNMLNEHAILEAKLTAIECGECGLTMLECKCDDLEDG